MKIAIIGFGNIARKHIRAIEENEQLVLVAICELNLDIQTPEGIPNYQNPEDLYQNHPNIDFVSICTPNGFHEQHSIKALRAGFNVICEKPLSLSTESCNRIEEACKHSGKSLICVMQNRYAPVSQWLKKTVDSGVLGNIYMLNISCYWNRNENYYQTSKWRGNLQKDGGTLFTQFSHYVDSLYWLFGKININNAIFDNHNHGSSIEFEDSGIFTFNIDGGIMGSFSYTTATYRSNFESTFTILAENGTIKIAGQYMDRVEYCDIKELAPPIIETGNNINNLGKIYKNAQRILNNKTADLSSLKDGTEVVSTIESVYSFKTRK